MRTRRHGVRGARAGRRAALAQPVLRLHQRRAHVLLRAHTQALQVPPLPPRHTTTLPETPVPHYHTSSSVHHNNVHKTLYTDAIIIYHHRLS